ncbi:DUF58 domain-containing protein [Pseudazoarcus pumilus]|uniref:DUF58 domain-containing protein n=1 Tax=Pseudazoarcus pumilus TaxID=2067960 RepID=A0A2I6S8L4_9RHOO|nr:DUF58 domain-containing protein [Pseudazoarcus pumilus]AUN95577.1 hypothetical protein C0099_11940 [Pseudazoarcus pumilus]
MRATDALEGLPDALARKLGRRDDDSLPVTLRQGRIYVLPTGAGLAFALALMVMLVGAINYGLSLGYALVFLLFGLGVAGTVHAFRNLHGLRVVRASVEPVFAGETATLRVHLENPSNWRRPALRVRVGDTEAHATLDAGAADTLAVAIPTEQRGWHAIERITLYTTWPLGLARAWSVLRPAVSVLVYAAPERNAPPLPSGAGSPEGLRPQGTGDDDFAGLRSHRLTDSPRHVAWKAVAAGGPMLTKEFAGHAGAALELDWHALGACPHDEARAARLTAWVLAAEARAATYALTTPDGRLASACGRAHLSACLARLALARSRRGA